MCKLKIETNPRGMMKTDKQKFNIAIMSRKDVYGIKFDGQHIIITINVPSKNISFFGKPEYKQKELFKVKVR